MGFRTVFSLLISALLIAPVYGQFRLPAFDISLKPAYLFIDDEYHFDSGSRGFKHESIGLQGEIHLQLSQRIAIGWVYNKTIYGNYHESWSNNGAIVDKKSEHLFYGLNLRVSGGRSSKLRPYIQGKYYWIEVVVRENGYRTAADMKGMAAGVGLMLRVNNKLYFNLIEGEVCSIAEHDGVLFGTSKTIFPQFRSGLTYNFSKRK